MIVRLYTRLVLCSNFALTSLLINYIKSRDFFLRSRNRQVAPVNRTSKIWLFWLPNHTTAFIKYITPPLYKELLAASSSALYSPAQKLFG